MATECTASKFELWRHFRRRVTASFDGGRLTSDAGGVLVRLVDDWIHLTKRFALCFADHRRQSSVEHSVLELLRQRLYGLILAYEDLIDFKLLRKDPGLALLVGKADITGADRVRARDQGSPLASASTLNRVELSSPETAASDRHKRVALDMDAADALLVDVFLEAEPDHKEMVLDIDATDDPVHGHQEGRFFHGYYRRWCYLPLYVFCDRHLLRARLRRASEDPAAGAVAELRGIVCRIREQRPGVRIIVRGDSGFCREEIMRWCESEDVAYVFGLARNRRLEGRLAKAMQKSRRRCLATGKASRRFREFRYRTLGSWSRSRRVIGKAEWLPQGGNPRFVVTNLEPSRYGKQALYEKLYCARGEMENRIKEQQLDLFADRTSTATMRGNQIRLYFSAFAYVLFCALRRIGLRGTSLERAQCGTIRSRLLKIAARIRVTHRRIWVQMASESPHRKLFAQVLANLRAPPTPSPA